MSAKLRFGVLGAGQISRLACPELQSHLGAEVVAVSDSHPARLAELSSALGGVKSYADSRELCAAPDIDAVYVATPNALHAELAVAALEHGKHVLVEKPFATSAEEAERMVEASKRAGKLLSVAMNQRFRADSQRVAALVQRGALGHVYMTQAFWHRRSGIPKLGTWFGSKKLAGGGALYDIGVHLLDLALFALGRFDPLSVSGQVHTSFGTRGIGEGGWGLSDRAEHAFDVDDAAVALLRFADGATLSLEVSWAIHQREPDRMNVLLHGTEAGAGLFPGELYTSGKEAEDYRCATVPELPLAYPHQSRFHNFIGAILGTESLCVTPAQALGVQRILDAIYESSRLGSEVMLRLR